MKRNKLIVSILMISLLLFTMAYIGIKTLSVTEFTLGYLPYGESSNSITDLSLVSSDIREVGTDKPYPTCLSGTKCLFNYNSKYWTIEQNLYNCDSSNLRLSSSNDFSINMGYSRIAKLPGEGMGYCNIGGTITTKEYFNDRDFKASISRGLSVIKVYLVTDSQKILAYNSDGSSITNLIISPSVISNNIYVYVNGQLYQTLNSNSNYKVAILVDRSEEITITNPSYKQQFGCTTLPSEQTYLSVFKEGDIININKLDRFNKFCLDESPLKVYSNTGSTTDIEVLSGLVNNEQYNVPAGQIWTIEYIGDKSTLITECENSSVYVQNDKTCIARAMITLTCPVGSSFDSEKGFCVVETKPSVYYTEIISTHQALEQKGEVLLSNINNEGKIEGDSINILGNFKSNGVSYNGMDLGNVNYPEDESNWEVSFTYDGVLYEGKLNDEFKLSDYLNVKILDINGYKSKIGSVESYKVNYIFTLDTPFIELSEKSGKVIVKNTLMNLDGGITLTTTNNIGTTKVETIEKVLILGNTEFVVDTNNLLGIKARPFISISTPQYDYKIDTKNAIFITLESQTGTSTGNEGVCSDDACCKEKGFDSFDGVCKKVVLEKDGFKTSTIIISSLVGLVILMILIIFMLKLRKK